MDGEQAPSAAEQIAKNKVDPSSVQKQADAFDIDNALAAQFNRLERTYKDCDIKHSATLERGKKFKCLLEFRLKQILEKPLEEISQEQQDNHQNLWKFLK